MIDRFSDLVDFTRVEEELARPPRLVRIRRVRKRLDGQILQVKPIALERRPSIGDVDRPRPHRFHLAAHEHHPRLEPLFQVIVEGRPPVLRQHFLAVFSALETFFAMTFCARRCETRVRPDDGDRSECLAGERLRTGRP